MDKKLTIKQQQVLKTIERWVDKEGTPPKLRHIMEELGYNHLSSVHRHVELLKSKGMLPDTGAWSHGIKLSHNEIQEIPMVGNVPCGAPLLAEENIEAYVSYSTSKLRSKSAKYFFLRATGDSMNMAGIEEGDLLLVRKQPIATRKDIVIAMMSDGATCKRLELGRDGWYILKPESYNRSHKPIVMLEDSNIIGVVEKVVTRRNGVAVT